MYQYTGVLKGVPVHLRDIG